MMVWSIDEIQNLLQGCCCLPLERMPDDGESEDPPAVALLSSGVDLGVVHISREDHSQLVEQVLTFQNILDPGFA